MSKPDSKHSLALIAQLAPALGSAIRVAQASGFNASDAWNYLRGTFLERNALMKRPPPPGAASRAAQSQGRARPRRRRRSSGSETTSGLGSRAIRTQGTEMPTAIPFTIRGGGGLANQRAKFCYLIGTIYTGNDTLGKSGDIYLTPANLPGYLCTNTCPITPASGQFGVAYIADIWKHYLRKRFHSIVIHTVPIGAGVSTGGTYTVSLMPFRGGAASTQVKNDTTANNFALTTHLGSSGSVAGPSYKSLILPLTGYIAGGSGARQNEFNAAGAADTTALSVAESILDIPCAVSVSGQCSSGFGVNIGYVYATLDVELLDFIASSNTKPQLGKAETGLLPGLVGTSTKSDMNEDHFVVIPPHKLSAKELEIANAAHARLLSTTTTTAVRTASPSRVPRVAVGAGGPPPQPSPRPSLMDTSDN